jgi:hypothetical protein
LLAILGFTAEFLGKRLQVHGIEKSLVLNFRIRGPFQEWWRDHHRDLTELQPRQSVSVSWQKSALGQRGQKGIRNLAWSRNANRAAKLTP